MTTPAKRLERRARAAAHAHGLHAQPEDLLEIAVEPLGGVVLEAEGLDQAGASQQLGQPRGHVADLGVGALGDRAQAPADAAHGQHRQRI